MRKSIHYVFTGAAVTLACLSLAQEPRPEGPTLDQRLTALEAGLATLDTRLGLATARPPDSGGQSDVALAGRITTLERDIERLAGDIQRVERLADSAARAAGDAQRAAASALSICPDCGGRLRVIADVTRPDIIQRI